MSMQWSTNERLKTEEEGGKESVICVKGVWSIYSTTSKQSS